MSSKILIATTAAALAAGTYYAVAQGTSPSMQGPSATGSGSLSQPDSINQNAPGSERKLGGTSGQSTSGQGSNRSETMGQKSPGLDRPATSGQAPSAQSPGGSSTMSPAQRSGSEQKTMQDTPSQRSGAQTSPSGSQTSKSNAQSTTGSAGVSANLSTEQRTQIRQSVLARKDAPRVSSVNFSLNVGTVVPRSVKLVAVPPTLVEIQPAWRGYRYFLVGDEVVIVEPATLKIVAVIAA